MTDFELESATLPQSPLSDDLPPVQPPSAGFIVQLFLFPALIAAGEQDWRKLLQDLQSQNLMVRNRAMYGLAQVLDQDSRRGDQGQQLRNNREIAQGLADQLSIELKKNSSSSDNVAIQEYLARALGMMDSLDAITPALQMALEPQRDVDIRKSAVVSLSLIAGRAKERGAPLSDAAIINSLVELSADPLPILRQSSAFDLGLYPSPGGVVGKQRSDDRRQRRHRTGSLGFNQRIFRIAGFADHPCCRQCECGQRSCCRRLEWRSIPGR